MSEQYECLVPIDHTADHRIYPAGAIIALDHLTAEKVQLLVGRGYVKAVESKAAVKPSKAEAEPEAKNKPA